MSRSRNNNNSKSCLASPSYLTLGISIFLVSAIMIGTLEFRATYAETGMGKDVFKVIVSVFGISNDTGDMVTTVNVNGNSKVKSFDSDNINYWQPSSADSNTRLLEYIATFPGVEVNPGDHYKACVLLVETSHTICKEGANSAGKRPEVVDISLDSDAPTTPAAVKVEASNNAETTVKNSDTEKADTQKDTEKADTQKDTETTNAETTNAETNNTEIALPEKVSSGEFNFLE
ncbi:MAG TPA: hypothetical protein VH415_03535 [Nitrososphaeraceae archaeon]